MRTIVSISLLAACGLAGPSMAGIPLQADFNDLPFNQPIGTGGPELGEPVSVNPGVEAIVASGGFYPLSLRITDNSTVGAGAVRFEFSGGELDSGIIVVAADLWFEELGNYTMRLREGGTSADQFGNLTFASNGNVLLSDDDSSSGVVGSYEIGRRIPVRLVYDLDAGLYDCYYDGSLVADDEPHGVVDDGLGALLFGHGFDGDLDGSYLVDSVSVSRCPLRADFDTLVVGSPIGTGGPAASEPVSLASGLGTNIATSPFSSPGLTLIDESTTTAVRAGFEFFGGEITSGTVTISADLAFDSFGNYSFLLRELGSAADSFMTLRFYANGDVGFNDEDTPQTTIATYDIGRRYPVSFVYDLDAGTYDMYLDGQIVLAGEPHGVVGNGIGAVYIGHSFDADVDGLMAVDNLVVCEGASPVVDCLIVADFDDATIGAPIGTGGATVGEPVSVSGNINSLVTASPFDTPSLRLSDNSDCCAGTAIFDLIGDEITCGVITINAELWFESFDNHILYVREEGSAADSFASLKFDSNGGVLLNDVDSPVTQIGTYDIGRPYPVSLVYDMTADTYDVYLDGVLVLLDEPHGVTGNGVGSVLIGLGNDADLDGTLWLDRLTVCNGQDPIVDCGVIANFDDLTIDAPIETGGPMLGQPVSVSPDVNAIVRSTPFGTPSLEITDNDDFYAGAVRFEFIGGEVTEGSLTINADLWFHEFESYFLYVREEGSSADSFNSLSFESSGSVFTSDADSSPMVIGCYETGRPYPVSLVYDMDAGTYDVYLDGTLALADEPHGVTDGDGVGAVLFGMLNDADFDGMMSVDNVSVCDGDVPNLPTCPEDIDGSGAVDVSDLLALLGAWGSCDCSCAADIDGNGMIDVSDLLAVLGAWGPCS